MFFQIIFIGLIIQIERGGEGLTTEQSIHRFSRSGAYRISSPHLRRVRKGRRVCVWRAGGENGGPGVPPVSGVRRVWARLTRCLYRGMYNNRLRRWHRYPFVSVGGHLGFPSAANRRRGPTGGGIYSCCDRERGGGGMVRK